MNEIKIFKIRIHPLSKAEFLHVILKNLTSGEKTIQNGVNASSVCEIEKNEESRIAYLNSDLINIDGISVVWALRFLGFNIPERVACPDLAHDVLKLAETFHFRVFLLGAQETSLKLCVQELMIRFPSLNIAGSHNGYFSEKDDLKIVELINNVDSEILFLGMPSPRKELFIEKYKSQLKTNYVLGVGGYFDILSGLTKRAPEWMQKIGMEWFYRFIQEPKRMFRRYLVGNATFIWLVIKEKFFVPKDAN